MQPIYEKSSNKNVHYAINDQFLKFWFRFIYKYTHIIEAGGNDRLRTIVERDFSTFSGKSLESYFLEVMKESGEYTRLGYWHDRKGENEIDIVAEDELENKIEFIEVKRQEKNFDEAVLRAKSDLFFNAVGAFKGFDIVYGGSCVGTMHIVANTAKKHGSKIIGVMPEKLCGFGVASDYCDQRFKAQRIDGENRA